MSVNSDSFLAMLEVNDELNYLQENALIERLDRKPSRYWKVPLVTFLGMLAGTERPRKIELVISYGSYARSYAERLVDRDTAFWREIRGARAGLRVRKWVHRPAGRFRGRSPISYGLQALEVGDVRFPRGFLIQLLQLSMYRGEPLQFFIRLIKFLLDHSKELAEMFEDLGLCPLDAETLWKIHALAYSEKARSWWLELGEPSRTRLILGLLLTPINYIAQSDMNFKQAVGALRKQIGGIHRSVAQSIEEELRTENSIFRYLGAMAACKKEYLHFRGRGPKLFMVISLVRIITRFVYSELRSKRKVHHVLSVRPSSRGILVELRPDFFRARKIF